MNKKEETYEVSESFSTEVFRLSPDRKTVQVFACTLSASKTYDVCIKFVEYLRKESMIE